MTRRMHLTMRPITDRAFCTGCDEAIPLAFNLNDEDGYISLCRDCLQHFASWADGYIAGQNDPKPTED